MENTFGFIGLGLIGGSIAKAIRKEFPDCFIYAYDCNKSALDLAESEGCINMGFTSIDKRFSDCDLIFLCAPVKDNEANLKELKALINSETIITDVGSVKGSIHKTVKELGMEANFIGSHPMAGSERTGYANSKALLLQNAYYIITPSDKVSKYKVSYLKSVAQKIGAIPLIMKPEEHDYITAAISHLPHLIAASLVKLVQTHDSEEETMKLMAAGGFKDITRIASSSPIMWENICMTNPENINIMLEDYIESLKSIQNDIKALDGSKIYSLFDEARTYRDSFSNNSSGPIKKAFDITVDIADETGAIATISTILALNQISIKNIGIVHNREFQTGALRIELNSDEDVEKASTFLNQRGYTIYKK